MNNLDRSSSLHEIVTSINGVIDVINSSMGILKTLDNSSLGEQIEYTSTQDAKVIGEVFTVKVPGLYTFKTSGRGTTSILIQRNGDSEVSETILLYTDQESEELLLTANDKLLFYVTSLKDTYTVCLTLKKGLFAATQDMLKLVSDNKVSLEELKSYILNSIERYTAEYQELIDSNNSLRTFIEDQISSMNNTISELSNRINTL